MRPADEHGFTLIELLVTMVVAMVVFGATLSVLEVFQTENGFDQLRNETQDNARNAMDRLARQLRNVVAPVKGAVISPGALEEAEPYSITFQTVDTTRAPVGENVGNVMRVRYCLNNPTRATKTETLWEQTERWQKGPAPEPPATAHCPETTSSGEESWQTKTKLVTNVTNRYGGQGKPELCAKETPPRCLFVYSATGVPQIVSVEASVFINVRPGQLRPGESQLTSGVSLRNANRLPIASLTATRLGSEVELNASGSHDPDGLALTYKWWQDGTPLSATSQRYKTGVLSTGTHTFKLEVTNPGGLSSEAPTQAVEIS